MRQKNIVSLTFSNTHRPNHILRILRSPDFMLRFCDTQMMTVFPQESSTETSWGFFG